MADRPLPAVSDDEILLLRELCEIASSTTAPPFAALSAAYDALFQQKGLETSRDNAVFRWILRLSEVARRECGAQGPINFIPVLTRVASGHGIEFVGEHAETPLLVEIDQSPRPANLAMMEARAAAADRHTLLRQSFGAWRLAAQASRQKEVDLEILLAQLRRQKQHRLLQKAFTHWDESARHQRQVTAVAQKRATMVKFFTRWHNLAVEHAAAARHLEQQQEQQALDFRQHWLEKTALRQIIKAADAHRAREAQLEHARAQFAEKQRQRDLRAAIQALNLRTRQKEDMEQAAIEFANRHVLTRAHTAIVAQARELQRLESMAKDFRFFNLAQKALRIWRQKTTQQQQDRYSERMKDNYAAFRKKWKLHTVRGVWEKWVTKTREIMAMTATANEHYKQRLFMIGTLVFDHWHGQTLRIVELNNLATARRERRLLQKAWDAMVKKQNQILGMEQQAVKFRQESDLMLAGEAFKQLERANFNLQRHEETAAAFRERTLRKHAGKMLRIWNIAAQNRKAERVAGGEAAGETGGVEQPPGEPESPSLGPASRLAARSAERPVPTPRAMPMPIPTPRPVPTPVIVVAATPAYLATPARSRRTVRFNLLPMPAPVTPFRLPGGGE